MEILKFGQLACYIIVCINPDVCRICTQFINKSLSSCQIVGCETNLLNEINEEILKLHEVFLFFSPPNTSKNEDIF